MELIYEGMPWAKEIVETATPIRDALRSLGYGLLRVLALIVDVLYDAIQGLLGINIMSIQPVQDFVSKVSPLGWSILVISLIGAFILLMLYPSKNKGELARGLFMAVCLMISIPFMFQTLNDFKNAGVDDVSHSISASNKPGAAVLQASTYDVASSIYNLAPLQDYNDPYYLNINARMPKDHPVFTTKIDAVINGQTYGSGLGNGFFGWGEERLYAYNYKLVEPLFSLLIMLVCLLFTGFKIGRLLFDLVTHQVIAPVVFASDVYSGGRSKKFMQSLISNYILMILILVLLKMYIDLTTWATSNVTDVWVRILLIAGASWGVIDGPDIILKLVGIDAGVRSASAVMMGANAAVNMGHSAGGAIAGAARTIKNAPGNIAGAAGSVAGAVSGLKNMAGNAEMGHGLGTNAQARNDAGIGGFMDMRNSMRDSGDSGSAGASGQTQSSGYSNVPKVNGGTLGDRFGAAHQKVSGGIGRTAATVGYAAGKTGSAIQNAASKISPTGMKNEAAPPEPYKPAPYPPTIPHGDSLSGSAPAADSSQSVPQNSPGFTAAEPPNAAGNEPPSASSYNEPKGNMPVPETVAVTPPVSKANTPSGTEKAAENAANSEFVSKPVMPPSNYNPPEPPKKT